MRRSFVFAAFSFLFLALGCNQGGSSPVSPPVTKADNLKLALFAAGWCENCPNELKEVDQRFKAFAKSSKVQVVVYMVEGDHNQRPSSDITTQYKNKLGLDFDVEADPWRWTYYRQYIDPDSSQLPAAAILDTNGNVVKVLTPGYAPVDVINELQVRLK